MPTINSYIMIVYFFTIGEWLAILIVTFELLANKCIKKCMDYFQEVQWSAIGKTQNENIISSLALKFSSDLAAMLDKEDINHMLFEKEGNYRKWCIYYVRMK